MQWLQHRNTDATDAVALLSSPGAPPLSWDLLGSPLEEEVKP